MFLPTGVRPQSDSYHAIVIGSGPAGLTTALELERLQRKVLVIESESGDGDLAMSIGYGHFSGDYWNAHWLRAFGGTSNAWAGWIAPLRQIDFDHPVIGVKWPIDHAVLFPYYQRAAGALNRSRATAGFERPFLDRWIYRPFSVDHPLRFGERHREALERSRLVDVALGHSVVGFDATPARSAITAVRCFDHRAKSAFTIPVRMDQAVVVAAGGMGNAQLLLQPRDDGSVPVGNEGGQVGKFLMEHPHAHGVAECVTDLDFERYAPPGTFRRYFHAVVLNGSVEAGRGLFGCSLAFRREAPTGDLARRLSMEGWRFYYRITARSEMRPTAHNRVFTMADRSRSGVYRVAARCVLDAGDLLNIEHTLRLFGESLIELNHGRVRINNDVLYREVTGGGHTMGTTRMGDRRAESVVDRDCRVHGYGNFFVAGSSVFPTGGYANPTFTILALAIRLAEHIARGV